MSTQAHAYTLRANEIFQAFLWFGSEVGVGGWFFVEMSAELIAELLQAFVETIEANFTQDHISKILTDYFYIAPLLSITYLLIAFFWIRSRPLDVLQFELTLWHFIFTACCTAGFWVLTFPIIKAIARKRFVYALCTNLITDNPWLSFWCLLAHCHINQNAAMASSALIQFITMT